MVLAACSFVFFFAQEEEGLTLSRKEEYELLIEKSKKIHKVWSLGMVPELGLFRENDCLKLEKKDFSCNPEVLSCLLKSGFQEEIQLKGEARYLPYTERKHSFYKSGVFQFKLMRNKQWIEFSFENNCSDIYLPQREYGVNSFVWNNFNRRLFIEKDIRLISFSSKMVEKMHEKCQLEGKSLLDSFIFDAASFHPGNIENKKYIPSRYSRFPDRSNEELSMYKKELDSKVFSKEKWCKIISTKECNILSVQKTGLSWSGINFVLGGEVELFQDLIGEGYNLKLSSRYLNRFSRWHSLFSRYIISDDFDGKIMTDREELRPEKFAFRCYKEVFY